MYETLTYELSDNILTLTLNRPDKLNAFTIKMADDIEAAMARANADDDVRAVIVTGAGRAFCAGADLEGGAAAFDFVHAGAGEGPIQADGSVNYSHPAVRDPGGRGAMAFYNSLKPVIVAFNGPAIGIGATMMLPADIRLASENAKFGFVFARRGIVPEAGSSFFLPRVVGINTAMEWCLTGRVISAAEAHEAGLIKPPLAPEALMPAAIAIARDIIDNTAPVSIALTRQMMWRGLGMAHPMEAVRIDSRGIFTRARSADAREGVMSFLQKRAAVFPQRVSSDMPDYFPWWDDPDYS